MPKIVQLKCIDRISRLADLGNELRRPEADYLRDGIYELRASWRRVHYRVLYFFAGQAVAVLSHGITKQREVPGKEIDRAVQRRKQVARTSPGTRSNRSRSFRKRKFDSRAVQFLYDRSVGNDPELGKAYEQETLNSAIARMIFELRAAAGLSQRELARRVGTSASALCRLEDADYDGHSLSLLKRIADALGKRVEVRFVSAR